jgi:hypothetical protein
VSIVQPFSPSTAKSRSAARTAARVGNRSAPFR